MAMAKKIYFISTIYVNSLPMQYILGDHSRDTYMCVYGTYHVQMVYTYVWDTFIVIPVYIHSACIS